MKKTVVLCAMLGIFSTAVMAAESSAAPAKSETKKSVHSYSAHLGVVDVNRLITESKWAGKLQDAIASDFKKQRDDLTKNEEMFRSKATAYDRDIDVLSESDRLDQERVLVELQEKLKKEQYLFSEALNKRREHDMEQFMNAVTGHVEEIAKKRQLGLVLPAELVLYATPDAEITSEILKGIDAEHAS